MKIAISYPPLESKKSTATLSQNRQFQWFSKPTYIYPVVPASAATLLKQNGYEVFWDDGIAEELSYSEWLERIIREKPDVIVIETKTPVIKRHWTIISEIKETQEAWKHRKQRSTGNTRPGGLSTGSAETQNWLPVIVLMGDHVTALPEESFAKCPVDYVLTGGDYDFMLLNLANHLSKGEELEAGWYFRKSKIKNQKSKIQIKNKKINNFQFPILNQVQDKFSNFQKLPITNYQLLITSTGKFQLNHDLDSLPPIDRQLTKWKLYGFKNGNFKYTPGTYIMASRDCWYAKCTFCSWANTLYPCQSYRMRDVKNVLDEIGALIKLGVKEIMDDSGTFPIGNWLTEFCQGMIERGYNKKVKISCNMRINAIKDLKIYQLMKQAGFRLILFGLESANQKTLDKLNKGLRSDEIKPCLKICKQAGLEPHITVMVGYPWETKQDTQNTLDLAKKLFHDGIVDSLQATIMIPYPGTELYQQFILNDRAAGEGVKDPTGHIDYNLFDQSQQVMQTQLSDVEIKKMIRQFYRSFFTLKFFLNKIKQIRSVVDIKFYLKAVLKLLGHLRDFRV